MEKLTAVVADDEKASIEVLTRLLHDTRKVKVIEQVTDPLKIESVLYREQPDVFFMDIEMPGLNGIDVVQKFRAYHQQMQVVFMTAFGEYMPEAVKLNTFNYLLKPLSRQELSDTVNKLVCKHMQQYGTINGHRRNGKMVIPVNGGYAYLDPREVFYLGAQGNDTLIHSITGEEYLSSYNLGRLQEKLACYDFMRINRSTLMNRRLIFKIGKHENRCYVRVNHQEYVFPVTRTFIAQFNQMARTS